MNMDCIKKEITDYIKENFSEKRRIHTEGVRITALNMAEKYGENVEKTEIAACSMVMRVPSFWLR